MSTVAVAKATMNYLSATQRPQCRNCKHGDEQFQDRAPQYERAGWRCTKGGFFTTAFAICAQYEPKRIASAPPPVPGASSNE